MSRSTRVSEVRPRLPWLRVQRLPPRRCDPVSPGTRRFLRPRQLRRFPWPVAGGVVARLPPRAGPCRPWRGRRWCRVGSAWRPTRRARARAACHRRTGRSARPPSQSATASEPPPRRSSARSPDGSYETPSLPSDSSSTASSLNGSKLNGSSSGSGDSERRRRGSSSHDVSKSLAPTASCEERKGASGLVHARSSDRHMRCSPEPQLPLQWPQVTPRQRPLCPRSLLSPIGRLRFADPIRIAPARSMTRRSSVRCPSLLACKPTPWLGLDSAHVKGQGRCVSLRDRGRPALQVRCCSLVTVMMRQAKAADAEK